MTAPSEPSQPYAAAPTSPAPTTPPPATPPPGYSPPPAYPPPAGYAPLDPSQPPAAAAFGAPVTQPTLNAGVGIGLSVVVAAVAGALYGFILASSNSTIGWILAIGGVLVGGVLARTSIAPIVRGLIGAVLVGGAGFAAIVYGGFGQLAKQARDAGYDVTFGDAVKRLSVSDVLDNVNGGTWVFFAIAVIVSFAVGVSGARRFRR